MTNYKYLTNTDLVDAFEKSLKGMVGDDFFDIALEIHTRAQDNELIKKELLELVETLQSIHELYRRYIINSPEIPSIKQAIIQRLKTKEDIRWDLLGKQFLRGFNND